MKLFLQLFTFLSCVVLTSCEAKQKKDSKEHVQQPQIDTKSAYVINIPEGFIKTLGPEYQDLKDIDPGFEKLLLVVKSPKAKGTLKCTWTKPVRMVSDKEEAKESFLEIPENYDTSQSFESFFSSKGFLPGERCLLKICTARNEIISEISFIPRPIQIKDSSNKVKIEAELISLCPAFYKIFIHNVNATDECLFNTESKNEKLSYSHVGVNQTVYSPDVIGFTGGIGYFSVQKTGDEKYTLELPWGTAFNPYINGEK